MSDKCLPVIIAAAQATHKFFYPKGPFASVTLAQWAVESRYGGEPGQELDAEKAANASLREEIAQLSANQPKDGKAAKERR